MNPIRNFGKRGSLIMMVIGVLLLLFRVQVAGFIASIIGLVILFSGACCIISELVSRNQPTKVSSVVIGIILACIGGFLLLNRGITVTVAGLCIGVPALLAGIDRFRAAVTLFKGRKKGMDGIGAEYAICSGLVQLCFGVLMCVAPVFSVSILVMILGIYCLVSGVMMLISTLRYPDM